MTTTEFDLLLAFCRYPGRVLSREDLLSMTYAGPAGPIEHNVDVRVSGLPPKDRCGPGQAERHSDRAPCGLPLHAGRSGGARHWWPHSVLGQLVAIVFVTVVTVFLVAAVAEDSFKHAVGGGLDDDEYRSHIAFLVVAVARQSGSELGREGCGRMAATAVTPLRIEKAMP
jgi:hypothetical protein